MLKARTTTGSLLALGILLTARSGCAQDASAPPLPLRITVPAQSRPHLGASATHKFWDKENVVLFAGVALARGFDYSSTQHFRERRVNEILLTNSIVDNKPLFASIELAGTAASVAVSYWLHHKGHHRAERWVSIVHIGVATFGDIRNYGLSNLPSK